MRIESKRVVERGRVELMAIVEMERKGARGGGPFSLKATERMPDGYPYLATSARLGVAKSLGCTHYSTYQTAIVGDVSTWIRAPKSPQSQLQAWASSMGWTGRHVLPNFYY